MSEVRNERAGSSFEVGVFSSKGRLRVYIKPNHNQGGVSVGHTVCGLAIYLH
jgi:hypothetical protein